MSSVALITGAARRVGAATARCLHEKGMNIVIHYHTSVDEAQNLCADLNARRPDSAVICAADLNDLSALTELVNMTLAAFGRCDLLVNNASRFYPTPLNTVTETAWEDLFSSNLKGAFFLSQALYPHLKAVQGAIINITDIHARQPMKDYPVYCMAKAGLAMMTAVLAKEMSPEVRVNAVAPGVVAWPEHVNALSAAEQARLVDKTLLKRAGKVNDIAEAVAFLYEASYITGQTLTVDGGRSLK